MEENKQKVIAYIDGFNFYYGLRQHPWKKYYWLDVVKLIESFLRPNQELIAVKYFSRDQQTLTNVKDKTHFFKPIRKIQSSNLF